MRIHIERNVLQKNDIMADRVVLNSFLLVCNDVFHLQLNPMPLK